MLLAILGVCWSTGCNFSSQQEEKTHIAPQNDLTGTADTLTEIARQNLQITPHQDYAAIANAQWGSFFISLHHSTETVHPDSIANWKNKTDRPIYVYENQFGATGYLITGFSSQEQAFAYALENNFGSVFVAYLLNGNKVVTGWDKYIHFGKLIEIIEKPISVD